MPNICENTIKIVGDTDKVNQLLADMTTDGYEGRSMTLTKRFGSTT